jgi:optic atrophy 3 protein
MRLRLGLLQDPAAIDRQIERELKEVERARQKAAAPTVKTEAQMKAEEEILKNEKKQVEEHVKASIKPPRIRPLSEAKAIDTGANFIAETFLFLVAGGLILLETWRRDRKDKKQDADVAEKLEAAEKEREEIKAQMTLLQKELDAVLKKKPFKASAAAPKTGSDSSAVALQASQTPPKSKDKPEAVKSAEAGSSTSIANAANTTKAEGVSSLLSWLPSSLFGSGKGSSS